MLSPFWGKLYEAPDSPDYGRFDDLAECGKEFLQIAGLIEDAGIILLPFEYKFDQYSEIYDDVKAASQKSGKPVLIFYNNDSDKPIEFPNAIILRTSVNSSMKPVNVYGLPGWSMDFKKSLGDQFYYRTKNEKPTVGYCGYVDYPNLTEYIKRTGWISYLKIKIRARQLFPLGFRLRGKAVRVLNQSKNIQTRFIFRDNFWASNIPDKKLARKEYMDNMIHADYAIVARGGGNFSYRLYEVMSSGRIPAFVNTDCVLPYEDFVDWKEKFVWIDSKQINKIDSKIKKYHNSLSNEEFMARQKEIRHLYEEWISPVGFHKKLHFLVDKIKADKKKIKVAQ
jgi:hypothetical protein